ncbi:glycosyltransferase family 39 protein [Amycolatopsis sp. OK19-0408]|uniref:Glycosyltransferase family 39 protein n=1 Tax=Amycolatopsis iheyensis TaxID=2945988 RepID=A0A9X2NH97_9PSEU|nr:glycosyltransferase family 39 protein [Amycolatopsis iheyensis]MCR6486662.1 glycosyltransferase family 39 protein [Amycolatopsis iheyensis]
MGVTTAPAPAVVRPVAAVPVAVVTALMAIPLLLTANRYGYFGDELYFLAAGRHLAWGYVDQPPLLPLLARTMDTLGHSPFVLRIPAMLAMLGGVVLTALIARELGGGAKAQTLAAATFAVSTNFLAGGHYLATSTVDPFLWTLLLWLLVRWLRTRADGLLVWAGVVTAVALYTKFLIGGFWLAAGVAMLACGPRDLVRRPALWLGAGIAVVALVPTLVWQAMHGWPQLGMGAAISEEVGGTWGGRLTFLPTALVTAGLPVGAVLLCYGLWRLLRDRELRFLGWTTLLLTIVFLAVNGRFYYVAGMYPVCWAVAAVALERREPSRWWRWLATWPCYVLAVVFVLPVALPIWPRAWLTEHPSLPSPVFAFAEIGAPEATRSVAGAFASLPGREHTAVVTETYWEASALDRYGRDLGLPEPASGNRGYATLVVPPESATDVLFVGANPRSLLGHFADVRPIGKVDTGAAKPSYFDGAPLWLATGRVEPWSALWPKLVNTHT